MIQTKINASAGNRTRVNCLEGSYAHHYTTDADKTHLNFDNKLIELSKGIVVPFLGEV